jgi:acyl-CoA synthetase (AMP-forming)/AMP-acid ligase II
MSTGVMVAERTVTQRLLELADTRDGHPALAGRTAPAPCSYPELSLLLRRAAAGLVWRGVRPRDVVGVYVGDAASYILGCHAIRAAGGVPSPVAAGLSVPEMAGQLADCGARMLLTDQALVPAALAAADRSWVRQVISFGEAAGATPFAALLGLGTMPPAAARGHDPALLGYARRGDGTLGPATVTHVAATERLHQLAAGTALSECDVVVAAPPAGDGRAYTALLDHALLSGATVVAAAACELARAADEFGGTVAVVPAGLDPALLPALRILAVDE